MCWGGVGEGCVFYIVVMLIAKAIPFKLRDLVHVFICAL